MVMLGLAAAGAAVAAGEVDPDEVGPDEVDLEDELHAAETSATSANSGPTVTKIRW
jgi:hypothetical protein